MCNFILDEFFKERTLHSPSQVEYLTAIIYLLCPHFGLLILILISFPLVTYNSLLAVNLKSHSVMFYFNFRDVYNLGTQIGHSIFFFYCFLLSYTFFSAFLPSCCEYHPRLSLLLSHVILSCNLLRRTCLFLLPM